MTTIHHAANVEASTDKFGLTVRILSDITAQNSTEITTAVMDEWAANGRPRRLIVDLHGVHHIDSSGAGALMEIKERATQDNVRVIFCGLESGPRRLLERTGISRLFDIRESPDERTALVPPIHTPRDRFVDEPPKPKRTHRAWWALLWLCVIVGGLTAIGIASYPTLQNYHAQLQRVPVLSGLIGAIDNRVQSLEQGLKNQFLGLEARLNGHSNAERRQRQRIQAEMDRRTAEINMRLDSVEAAQRATDVRVMDLQQQIGETRESPPQ